MNGASLVQHTLRQVTTLLGIMRHVLNTNTLPSNLGSQEYKPALLKVLSDSGGHVCHRDAGEEVKSSSLVVRAHSLHAESIRFNP